MRQHYCLVILSLLSGCRAQNLVCQEEVASRVIYILFSSIYIIYVYRCRCGSRLMNLPSITRSVKCMTGAWSPTATTSSTTTPPTTTSTNTVRPAATAEVQGAGRWSATFRLQQVLGVQPLRPLPHGVLHLRQRAHVPRRLPALRLQVASQHHQAVARY